MEIKMELASVIIPVYNGEKYLENCVQSVLNQTYQHIQIIIVNDGSTDGTKKICDDLKKKYESMIIIHQKNQGVSAARNIAMKKATGKYIYFIDCDDIFKPDFIEKMMKVDEKYDYVASGFIQSYLTGKNTNDKEQKCLECELTLNKLKKEFKSEPETLPLTFVWGTRYKRSIIEKYKLNFDINISLGEDIRFNLKYLENVEWVKAIDYCGIIHVFHPSCATGKFYTNRLENVEGECRALEDFLELGDKFFNIKYYYWHLALAHYKTYYKKKVISKAEYKKFEKKVYQSNYFRSCLNYIIETGTLDMRMEARCIKYHIPQMYPYIYKMVIWGSKIKMEDENGTTMDDNN